jgi:membrane glycosyltransferase
MNRITLGSIVLAVLLAPVGALLLYGPVHDFIALRNTVYSSPSAVQGYTRITVGMHRAKVIELLGAPLSTAILDTNYPSWSEVIESLTFSRPKRHGDYDLVFVWIGADQKVTWHGRAVTD